MRTASHSHIGEIADGRRLRENETVQHRASAGHRTSEDIMDGSRFDDLLRVAATSRRGAFKLLLGIATAGGTTVLGGKAAAKSQKPFHNLGKFCSSDSDCGLYSACIEQVGFLRCLSTQCFIKGTAYEDGQTNPENSCQYCKTLQTKLHGAENWHSLEEGETCHAGGVTDPCNSSFIATCQSGACVPSNVADGTPCGESSNACTALTCQSGICEETPTNEGGDCDNGVNGVCVNRFGSCLGGVCNGNEEPDGSNCGLNQVCCHRVCCPSGATCNAARQCENIDPGGGCEGDACGGTCVIEGVTYAFGDHNPKNNCQICAESFQNPTTFWQAANDDQTACGEPPVLRACCSGVCCPPDQCCGLGIDGPHCTSICPPPAPCYRLW
jgi:hypothetical protein